MRSLLAARLQSLRGFSASARCMENQVSKYQKIFQADNDLPVHLKGGKFDMLMYRVTMAIATLGTGYVLYAFYHLGKIKEH